MTFELFVEIVMAVLWAMKAATVIAACLSYVLATAITLRWIRSTPEYSTWVITAMDIKLMLEAEREVRGAFVEVEAALAKAGVR